MFDLTAVDLLLAAAALMLAVWLLTRVVGAFGRRGQGRREASEEEWDALVRKSYQSGSRARRR